MVKKPNYYNRILHLLQELHTAYPQYNMGKHLSTVLDECGNVWAVSDREIAHALARYKGQLEMDFPHTDDSDLDDIIKQGLDLDNILNEEDGDY